uniref:Mediator of RNA polymerase II transcription subunit 16 n=1 Tax=Rousettus aegyptiacus TaxID=9407 RepID=A0A7J8BTA3_ROUAE|nr:mediator complex subunit 16 [Rousettus aegyptiacus]
MDLAYVCEWEKWPKSTHCPSVPLACAWSCRNLIAFTTDLRNDDQDLTRLIHILDTEHPWDVHSINSEHSEAITCLEWDQSGSRLLSADANGQIKCWSMADHLANSWESPVGSLVEGDPIVALSWLHNGVKLALHVEKSGASSFGEKFSRVKFSPSLTLFGGKPMEGWIAVTVSGLVTVSLLKPSGQVLTSTESLCRLRGRVALADIAFTGGGNIVVATADGSSASPVQFYKVCVGVVSEKCRIDTEILPSLFMRCTADPSRKDRFPAITHLKFLARDMSEQVLLCASSQTSSSVECWSLRKEGLPVNNVFQQISPVVGDKQPMILKWRILSATNDLDRVSAVALPKLPISLTNTDLKVASDTQFYPGLDHGRLLRLRSPALCGRAGHQAASDHRPCRPFQGHAALLDLAGPRGHRQPREAEHAPHLAVHGPPAGPEPSPAAPALPAGVLHGDRLRLVGHPAARAARHGAEPGGPAARGVHAPDRRPAAGPLHPDPGHEGLAVQAVTLHGDPRVRLPRQALPHRRELHPQVPAAPTHPQHTRQESRRPAGRDLRQGHRRRHRQGHDQPQDGGVRAGHEHAPGAAAAPAVGGRLRALPAGQPAQPGRPAAARPQLPAGRRRTGPAAGADGRHPHLGAAEAQLPARVHRHLRHAGQHVPALPPAHQAVDLLPRRGPRERAGRGARGRVLSAAQPAAHPQPGLAAGQRRPGQPPAAQAASAATLRQGSCPARQRRRLAAGRPRQGAGPAQNRPRAAASPCSGRPTRRRPSGSGSSAGSRTACAGGCGGGRPSAAPDRARLRGRPPGVCGPGTGSRVPGTFTGYVKMVVSEV